MTSTSNEQPIVSVVVGVLNGAATLEKCIDSIARQTLVRRELIIKDGGSSDGTLAILERRSNDITTWVSEPDVGLYSAWNRVLPGCRGEWICFLGCDDEFADDTVLERLLAEAGGPSAPDLICSRVAVTDSAGDVRKIVGFPWDWKRMKRTNRVAHPGLLHRAELFRKHGLFDDSYQISGDYEFLLRLGAGTTARFVDQVSVRMGGNGMSHRWKHRGILETWRVHARHPEIGRAAAAATMGLSFARLAARQLVRRAWRRET